MKKDKVIEVLHKLGFVTRKMEGGAYEFEFERFKLAYFPDKHHGESVMLALPGVCDVTEDNYMKTAHALFDLSNDMKFVKPSIVDGAVWMFYEHYLDGAEPTEQLIEHIVRILVAGSMRLRHFMPGDDDIEGDGLHVDTDSLFNLPG